ncbi:MAG: VWA domain-containing protein [Acidobacteria bacterium]|nr:MAG: VWA domain-containing protein [Acidobacteriota bacterium]
MRPAGILLTPLALFVALATLGQDASPSIHIPEPSRGDLLEGRVTLHAVVQAPPGAEVETVSFRVDGRLLGDLTEPPYQVVWEKIDPLRDHLIRATARFSDGTRAYDLRSIPVLGLVTRATVLGDEPDRVLLGVLFLDSRGEPITDVQPEEIRVYEDGRRQAVDLFRPDDRPLSVQLLLDASASTQPYWTALSRSTRLFAETLRPGDRAGVEAFNDRSYELAPLGSPASDIETATSRFHDWGGGTLLYDVLSRSALMTVGQEHEGRRALVLLTDADDFGSALNISDATEYLIRTDVQVHAAVWFPENQSALGTLRRYSHVRQAHRALERLVQGTGGDQLKYSDYPLEEMFLRIGERLRAQYLLGYTSYSRKPAGKQRVIEVQLRRSGTHRVRYRHRHYGGQPLGVFLAEQMSAGPEARRMAATQAAVLHQEPEIVQALIGNLSEGDDVLGGLALEARRALLHLGAVAVPQLRDALSQSDEKNAGRLAQVLADVFVVLDRRGHQEALEEALLLLGHGDRRKGRRTLQNLLEQDLLSETRAGLARLLSTLEQEAS